MKYFVYKFLFFIVLRLPDLFFAILFKIAFPIYRRLHKKRAYGRTEKHLKNAKAYFANGDRDALENHATLKNSTVLENVKSSAVLESCSADDVFRGIYWNAIDSYRGLVRLPRVTQRIVFENEEIIREAIANSKLENGTPAPIAAISIHQGSFELLHRSLCRYSKNVHLVTDTLGDGALRRIIQELRSDEHLTEYSPDESRALIRNLFKTKGILAMVFDQGKHTKGNRVKLFGQDSTLYLRLPELVNQMGAGIVTFRTFTRAKVRDNQGRDHKSCGQFRGDIVIRFEKYYPPKYEGDLVNEIACEVETWITEHPAQWSWNYHGNFR